jgi:hypothetical protein
MLALAGVSFWGSTVRSALHDAPVSLIAVAETVFASGAFNFVAWAMVAAWAGGVAPAGTATRRQIAAAAAIGLICLLPTGQATIVALLALGVMLAIPAGTRTGRRVAALLICLAAEMAWSSTYALPLHGAVAALDSQAVGAVLGLLGQTVAVHGNVLENASARFGIEVVAFCSSSFPLVRVVLAFLVTLLYCGRPPRAADLPWLAASWVASIALTELRLCLMAWSEPNYVWLHDGGGVTVYALAAVALAVLFPLLAFVRGGPAAERRA